MKSYIFTIIEIHVVRTENNTIEWNDVVTYLGITLDEKFIKHTNQCIYKIQRKTCKQFSHF